MNLITQVKELFQAIGKVELNTDLKLDFSKRGRYSNYMDKYYSYFYNQVKEPKNEEKNVDVQDLVRIICSSHHQMNNTTIDFLLREILIRESKPKEIPKEIKSIDFCFNNSKIFTDQRIQSCQDFRDKKEHFLKTFHFSSGDNTSLDFAEILKYLDYALNQNNSVDFGPIIKKLNAAQIYNNAFIPNNNFLQEIEGIPKSYLKISQRDLINHGICSNGQFLFLLTKTKTLFIFPIIFGFVSSSITVDLSNIFAHFSLGEISNETSIITCNDSLNIYQEDSKCRYICLQIKIEKLLKGSSLSYKDFKIEQTQKFLYISDGIFEICISNNNNDVSKIFVFYNQNQKKLNLQNLSIQIDRPDTYECKRILTESNGSTINFIEYYEEFSENNREKIALFRSYSLITGKFINIEQFTIANDIYSMTYDSINQCRWCTVVDQNSLVSVQKYYSFGGINPYIFNCQLFFDNRETFFTKLNYHLMHYYCSHEFPKYFSCSDPQLFLNLICLLQTQLHSSFKQNEFHQNNIIQSLIVLISNNLHNFKFSDDNNSIDNTNLSGDIGEIYKNLLELIEKNLPKRFCFLIFFPNISNFYQYNPDQTISILIELFNCKCKQNNPNENEITDTLIEFGLKYLEEDFDDFSKVSIKDIFPKEKLFKNVNNSIISLLLVHQRVLFRVITQILNTTKKTNHPCLHIQFQNFYEYFHFLFNDLSKISNNHYDENLSNFLFHNIVSLTSSIIKNTLSPIIFAQNRKNISIIFQNLKNHENSSIFFPFIYFIGKILSSLFTEIVNFDFINKIPYIIELCFINDTECLNKFYTNSNNIFAEILNSSSQIMKQFNEFLSNENSLEKIKNMKYAKQFYKTAIERHIDLYKYIIFALCRHLNCLEELLNKEENISENLKNIKAKADKLCYEQQYNANNLKYLCLILLTLEPYNFDKSGITQNFQSILTSLNNFLVHNNTLMINVLNILVNANTFFYNFSFLIQFINQHRSQFYNVIKYILCSCIDIHHISISNVLQAIHLPDSFKEKYRKMLKEFLIHLNHPEKPFSLLQYVFLILFPGMNNEFYNDLLKDQLNSFSVGLTNSYSKFAILKSFSKNIRTFPSNFKANDFSIMKLSLIETLIQNNPQIIVPWDIIEGFQKRIQNILTFENKTDSKSIQFDAQITIRQILHIIVLILDKVKASSLNTQQLFQNILMFIGKNFIISPIPFTFSSYFSGIEELHMKKWISIDFLIFLREILNSDKNVKQILISLIQNYSDNKSQYQNNNFFYLIGICATLGLKIEDFHPYTYIKVLSNMTINNYFVFPGRFDKNSKEFFKLFQITNGNNITILPYSSVLSQKCQIEVINEIPIDISKFPNFQIVKNIIREYLLNYKNYPKLFPVMHIFSQLLYQFSLNEDFINSFEDGDSLLVLLCRSITPYITIENTYKQLWDLQSFSSYNEYRNEYFETIIFQNQISYISHILSKTIPSFDITFQVETEESIHGYFGIISDNYDSYKTRYSVISFPNFEKYPSAYETNENIYGKLEGFDFDKKSLTFNINSSGRYFMLENKQGKSFIIPFPYGNFFRIIVCCSIVTKVNFTIHTVETSEIFKKDIESDFCDIDYPNINTEYPNYKFINYPNYLNKVDEKYSLEIEYKNYDAVKNLSNDLPEQRKIQLIFPNLSNYIIHFIKCKCLDKNEVKISSSLIEHQKKNLYILLSNQWITLSMLCVTKTKPNLISHLSFKLYRILCNQLEQFSQELFEQEHFPFSLVSPVWSPSLNNSQISLLLFQNDLKEALKSLVGNEKCVSNIISEIYELSEISNIYLSLPPQKSHTFIPGSQSYFNFTKTQNEVLLQGDNQYIIAFNNFQGILKNSISIETNENKKEILDTPYILYKNNQRLDRKLIIEKEFRNYDLSIIQVNSKSDELPNNWIFNTPFELILLIKNISYGNIDENERSLLKIILLKIVMIQSPFIIKYLNEIFEFIQIHLSTSPSNINIEHKRIIALFGGYINGIEDETIREKLETYYNYERSLLSSDFIHKASKYFPEFFSSHYINNISDDELDIPYASLEPASIQGDIYMHLLQMKQLTLHHKSIINFPFWDILPYWFSLYMKEHGIISQNNSNRIKVSLIKELFVNDMITLVSKWNNEYQSLLIGFLITGKNANSSPRININNFNKISKAVLSFIESNKELRELPKNVILLNMLFIWHFNFFREKRKSLKIPISFWNDHINLVPIKTLSEEFKNSFHICKNPDFHASDIIFQFDRFLSYTSDNYKDSFIYQFATLLKDKYENNEDHFRVLHSRNQLPWYTLFKNEEAVDASGPFKESLYESVSSIFKEKSKLFIECKCKDVYFVPNFQMKDENYVFFAIGVLLGVIIRTEISQNIPFAPFIWKYLAGELIQDEDILKVDEDLSSFFKKIESNQPHDNIKWRVNPWIGKNQTPYDEILPGRNENEIVKESDIETYKNECLAYRIQIIKPMLDSMKKGFYDNILLRDKNIKVTGEVISFLTINTEPFTLDNMKKLNFQIRGDSHFQKQFWNILERLDEKHLKLLYKFITANDTLPINKNALTISVRPLEKVDILPFAHTCFNTLELPFYSSIEKAVNLVTLAIEEALSMENA